MTVAQVDALWRYYERSMREAQKGAASGPERPATLQDVSAWLGTPVQRGRGA